MASDLLPSRRQLLAGAIMRRVLPALGLLLLSPLGAAFLLGHLPITALWALSFLIPMYGGGALLIRESVRRAGRGWPSILILALAYGVIEEGIATMSLFDPNYAGQRLLDYGYVPGLGIGVPWTALVLTLHVVWSISVPIAMVEVLANGRRTEPWLGRAGLIVTALLFLAGVGVMTAFSVAASAVVAAPLQLVASGAIAAGPLLTYTWSAFPQHPIIPVSRTVDLLGNTVFASAAVILIGVAALRLHRQSSATLAGVHGSRPSSFTRGSSPSHIG
jgi:hypothetical protein